MSNLITQAYDPDAFRQQGHQLVDQLADYLSEMLGDAPSRKVLEYLPPEVMYSRWQQDLNTPSNDQGEALFGSILNSTVHLHHPKYLGHQTSIVAPIAALAELLGSLLDPGMGVYEQGNAGVVMERILSEKLGELIGWGNTCGGFLTSGGTLGNLTSLLCARQVMTDGKVWENGYAGEQYAFMASSEAHYSVARAVQVMGMGSRGIVPVPVDDRYRMRTDLLESCFDEAEKQGVTVIGVVASSCATATGSYDELGPIADFCEAKKLWLHVDGAHGACVLFSEKHRHLLAGIERADSMIMDYHKMLMTPTLATSVLFRDQEHSFQTFAQKASYLWDKDEGHEWYNLGKRTFELTKSSMVLRVYALWKTYGKAIFAENVDRLYALAGSFTELLLSDGAFEVALKKPESNIVCYRFVKIGWTEEKTEQVNAAIRSRLVEDGEFFIVQTRLQGKLFLRSALMNPFTTEAALSDLIVEIKRLATLVGTGQELV